MRIALVLMPAWLPMAPPVGISVLKSALEFRGHQVTAIDFNTELFSMLSTAEQQLWVMEQTEKWQRVEQYKKDILPVIGPHFKKLILKLLKLDIDAIGFSTNIANLMATQDMARICRKFLPDVKIVFGGPAAEKESLQFDFDQGLIDASVIGEGEASCGDLFDFWEKSSHSSISIPGVTYRDRSGKLIEGEQQELVDMGHYPMPDYSDYDLSLYTEMSIEFSRGCVARCTFCTDGGYWRTYRMKSAERIVKELQYWNQKSGINSFRVVDSLINGHHHLLEEVADLIIESKLVVHWYGFCRIDKRLTPTLLAKLKKAGCSSIIFGIESGSQKVLDLMRKNYTLEECYQVVRDTHAAGIMVNTHILIGFPGEGWKEFAQTLKLIFDLRKELGHISPGVPLIVPRNSYMAQNPDRYNIILLERGNWRTKNFSSFDGLRKVRHFILVKFLKIIGINSGFTRPSAPNSI